MKIKEEMQENKVKIQEKCKISGNRQEKYKYKIMNK